MSDPADVERIERLKEALVREQVEADESARRHRTAMQIKDERIAEQAQQIERLERRLRDTEWLYRSYYVLCTEAGVWPGSAELIAAKKRFDATLEQKDE